MQALATLDAVTLDELRAELDRALRTVHHVVHRPPSLPLLKLLDAIEAAIGCRADATSASDPPAGMPMLIPVGVAAAQLGTSPSTMRKRIERGLVPEACKVGGIWMIPTTAIPDLRRRAA